MCIKLLTQIEVNKNNSRNLDMVINLHNMLFIKITVYISSLLAFGILTAKNLLLSF